MAIAFVAERGKLAGTASTGGELGVALTASKAGNALVACVSAPSGTLTISDALGNTWTRVQAVTNGTVQAAIFVAVLTKGSPTEAKVAGLGNKGKAEVAVFEFSGVSAAAATRTSGTATGSGTAVKAGPTTEATVAEDAYVAAFASSATSATLTAGGGATVLASVGQTGGTVGVEWHSGLGAAAQTAEGTFSVTGTWAGVVVVLRPEQIGKGSAVVTGGGAVAAIGKRALPPAGTLVPYPTATVAVAETFARGIVITPDGKHVYVGYFNATHISCLERQVSGELVPLATQTVVSGQAPRSLGVSPDGKHVYVLCYSSGELWAYSRNEATGVLTKVQALTGIGTSYPEGGGPGVIVSPDGKHVYTVNHAGSVLGFERNASTGALTKLPSEPAVTAPLGIGISPDGKNVYVGGEGEVLYQFSRNETTGALTALETVATPGKEPWGATVSPDGTTVYVPLHGALVAQYQRNPTTGLLTALSPASAESRLSPAQVVVSPGGDSAYTANPGGWTLAMFSRAGSGVLTPLSPRDTAEVPIQGEAICISPDGLSVYTTAQEPSRVVQYARTPRVPGGAANVTGGGTVAARGVGVAVGSARVSGAGAVVVSARSSRLGQSAITGAGAVTTSVKRLRSVTAPITGGGAVTATGHKIEPQLASGTAHVTGAGTVTTTVRRLRNVTALVTGAGTVAAAVRRAALASPVVTGGGTVTATGHAVLEAAKAGSAVVTGAGAVKAAGGRVLPPGFGLLTPYPTPSIPSPQTAPDGVVVSPDGKHVYSGYHSEKQPFVSIWERKTNGELKAIETVEGPKGSMGLAVSPDGKTVYVTGGWQEAEGTRLWVYSRNAATGLLTKVETVNTGLEPLGVTVSPDGKNVYTADQHTLTAFTRNTTTGSLTSLETWTLGPYETSSVVVSADGQNVYIVTHERNVTQFARNPTTGALTTLSPAEVETAGVGTSPITIALSPDGKQAYVTFYSGHLGIYDRAAGGALTFKASLAFAEGNGPWGVIVSPDGQSVYFTNSSSNTLQQYERASSGSLTALSPATVTSLADPTQLCISPDGASVYVTCMTGNSILQYARATGAMPAEGVAQVKGGGRVLTAGRRVAHGSAGVSGGGAVAVALQRALPMSGHVTGGGAVTASGRRIALAGAHVTGAGAVTARGTLAVGGLAKVTGGGALTASARRLAKGTASITAGGSTAATGAKVEPGKVSGSAFVHGAGSVLVSGSGTRRGTVAVTGGGAVTVRAGHLSQGSASVAGGGSPQAAGRKVAKVPARVSGGGEVLVGTVRLARVSVNVTGAGQARAVGAIALITHGTASVHGGGKVFGFGHFAVGLPLEPGGASSSRATGLSPEPRIIDPSVCWVRHVIRGAAGQPSAQPVAHVYFAREDVLTGNDGLNGRAGWQLAQTTAQLSNDGSFSIALPNGPGEDGILHRRRFRILTDENYEPGEEWLEFYRDPNDLVFVGTPTDYEKTPSTITIKGIDLPEILGGSMSSEVDVWDGHAPVDVMRHYCRLAVLCDGVDLTGALINSVAGEWSKAPYQRAGIKGVEADCWTAEARIRQTSPRATAVGQQYVALNLWGPSGLIAQLRVDLWEGLVYISSHWLEGGIEDQRLGLVMPGEVDLRVVARYDRLFFFVAGELVTEMRRWGIGEGKPFDAVESLEVSCYGLVELAVDGIHVESLAPFASRGASVPAVRTLPGLPPPTGLRARYYNAAPMYAATNKLQDIKARVWPIGLEPTVDRVEPQLNAANVGNIPNLPGAVAARWTGAIYLDLATSDRRIEVHQSAYTRIYVGRTLRKEAYMSNWGDSATQPWFEGPNVGPSLRAHLGTSEAGWYPIVIEQVKAGPANSLVLLDRAEPGTGAPVPQSRLSPIGVYADTIRLTPHRKAFGDIATTFGYQWRVEHRSLETGEFPGQISFGPLLGRQTNVTIDDEAVGTQAQVQGAALDCVDGLLIDAAGLADPKGSGQLTAQTVNYERALGHMALRQVYESLSEVSEEPLVEQRADSLLALRSSPNEQVGVRPSGQRDVVDLLPLTGAKAKLDWQPGDGVVLRLQNLDVRDESPRQLTGVTWNLHPDGTGAPTVTWRNRPRDIRTALRKLTSSILGPRRTYQGQVSIITGSLGGWNAVTGGVQSGSVDSYSRMALPVNWEQVLGVWLNVLELSGSPWHLEIGSVTWGEPLGVVGRYEVTQLVKPWATGLPVSGTYARVWGGTTGAYTCQLEARIIV